MRVCISTFFAVAVLSLCGCVQLNPFAPLPASRTMTDTHPTAKLEGKSETFTGRVVLIAQGYRFRPLDSEDILQLTRAKRRSAFVAEEINLQKYYEKTLVVHGRREGDWIWGADIVGQWLRPGESRGSNLNAPPVGPQQ